MKSSAPISILLVEDNPDHVELAQRALRRWEAEFSLAIAYNLDEAQTWLSEQTPDLVITDLRLPDGSGMEFLSGGRAALGFPVVVITSLDDDQMVVEAIKAGALDYVVKSPETYRDLAHIARRALLEWEHIAERRRAERSLSESVKKLRSLIENSADGIVLANEQGLISEWNPVMESITGIPRLEALGTAIAEVFFQLYPRPAQTTELRDFMQSATQDFLAQGSSARLPQTGIVTLQHRDGHQVSIEARYFSIETLHGYMPGAIIRDTTERKRIEDALRQSEHTYRLIFENTPIGILHFDQHGAITTCNSRLGEIIGSPTERIIGLNLAELPDQQLVAAFQAVSRGETGRYHGTYTAVTSGKQIQLRGFFSPLFDSHNQVIGGVGMVEDISEQLRAERLKAAVYEIAESASNTQNLDTLYAEIHATIRNLLPADNLYFALIDWQADELKFPYYVDEQDENPRRQKLGRGLTDYLLRTGKPLFVDPDTFEHMETEGLVETIGAPSLDWLGVPLKDTNQEVIGALVVQSYTPGVRYSQADMDVLIYVSSQVANAIQRRRAEEAEHAQRRLAEALLDTAAAISSSLELRDVFDRILTNLEKLVSYDSANLMLIEADYCRISWRRGRGEDWDGGGDETFPWRNLPTLRAVHRMGQPLLITDTLQDTHWQSLPGTSWIRSYAGIPLLNQGKVIGFLNLNSAQPGFFEPAQATWMQVFANQAAKAIENARLYSEVQRLAIQDELTGLYNRRGLLEFGRREVDRSLRFNHPLSVIFLDIDLFKNFNDKYSYATGDEVLRQLAGCLRHSLRQVDVISRYGGDEFVALLPETDLPAAQEVAERLRKAVALLRILADGQELHISISVGLALCTQDLADLEALIAYAGDQLHSAKLSGRNQVSAG